MAQLVEQDRQIICAVADSALADDTNGSGRERAKAREVILGRRPKLTGHRRREAIARREPGEVLTDIARSYNVSHSAISRLS